MIEGRNLLIIIPIISETEELLVLYMSGISTMGICSVYCNYNITKYLEHRGSQSQALH